MESISAVLRFFLNAIKALFLSPFYILYFVVFLIYSLLNFIFGGIVWIISGFSYGSVKENKYVEELNKKKATMASAKGREA